MIKNKIFSVIIALLGYISTMVDGDYTAFALMLTIAVSIFFTKESCFYED